MTANPHLNAYLENYLALPNPGFAIMLNAPWGAGKSHAINRYRGQDGSLYVSLFGAKNAEDINRAILMERLPLLDNAWTKGLGSVAGTALKMLRVDFKPENFAEICLPETLIFDDLERTGMSVPELFGHLNGFVEHQGKKVILLANEVELTKTSPEYTRYKEKLVGRTLRLNPDVDAAYTAFLAEIKDQATRDILTENKSRISKVFALSSFENLRLLRQAMLEFVQLYAALDDVMRIKKNAVSNLIAIYFALHMEHGKGSLGLEDLAERGGWGRAMRGISKNSEAKPKSAMELAAEKYTGGREDIHSGEVVDIYGDEILPKQLCIDLIHNGYAEKSVIQSSLRRTAIFGAPRFEEPWRTLWYWSKRCEIQYKTALAAVEDDLANNRIANSDVLMHVLGIFLDLSQNGVIDKSGAKIVEEAKVSIDELRNAGLLPPWGGALGRGSIIDSDSADGLGFSCRNSSEFSEILKYLQTARSEVFQDRAKTVAAEIMAKMPDDMGFVTMA